MRLMRAQLIRVWSIPTFLAVLLTGCAGDKSILDPAGRGAADVALVWWGMLGFFSLVLITVVALWLYTFRPRSSRARTAIEEKRLARRLILGGGVLLPVATIVVLMIFGVPAGQRMLPVPLGTPPDVIEVTGHQWWWEVRYPGAEGGEVVTANQVVMPAGEPVDFHVTGADVIHSFWIPRLGGKIDMVPGRTNRIRLEADSPGVFGAQCAEFCGTQHAHMQLYVKAMERSDYEAWLAERQVPTLETLAVQSDAHAPAREAFVEYCAQCHRVAGLAVPDSQWELAPIQGPDLSDIGARPTLGAGVLAMEEGAIGDWLRRHQQLKPGNRMPAHLGLEPRTLQAIGDWLETLSP
ncbi:cytochrome c oxidase subunit II [Vreelandella rituensis]|uniref:Cytochrome aa3 subunit 2 n=1 Tax=Vreelandella rituensis TaxID=2282306 RepID=A0A368U2P3_9GAMM|nr:cytochrome c oxidase subunit II [Halomonas rituensis]